MLERTLLEAAGPRYRNTQQLEKRGRMKIPWFTAMVIDGRDSIREKNMVHGSERSELDLHRWLRYCHGSLESY